MSEELKSDGDSVSVSARIPNHFIILIVGSLFAGGLGLGTVVSPVTEKESIQQCFDNALAARNASNNAIQMAQTALNVEADRGSELAAITAGIARNSKALEELRIDILERTHSRYTSADAQAENRDQQRKHDNLNATDAAHERRMNQLEKDIERLLNYH